MVHTIINIQAQVVFIRIPIRIIITDLVMDHRVMDLITITTQVQVLMVVISGMLVKNNRLTFSLFSFRPFLLSFYV